MSINMGIVIGANNPAYEGCAKVRVPALHGLPLTESKYNEIIDKYSSFLKYSASNIVLDGENPHEIHDYNISNFGKSNNGKVKSDDEIPWYPICYPFGHNVGPNLWDLVYVIDDSYVLGWANRCFIPTTK